MLTYEKVLEIFSDYLREDECAEVVSTHHGPALMMWEPVLCGWEQVTHCETPEKLFDALLEEYDKYYSYQLAEAQGIEDYTPEIKSQVAAMCNLLCEKRRETEQ